MAKKRDRRKCFLCGTRGRNLIFSYSHGDYICKKCLRETSKQKEEK